MSTVDLKGVFFIECEDLLVAMESGLRDLEAGASDSDTVNAVFRAVHSIKGGAGAFALDDLVSFAHKFETVLDDLRSDQLTPSADLFASLLAAGDHLSDLVAAARSGNALDPLDNEQALRALSSVEGSNEDSTGVSESAAFTPVALSLDLPLASPETVTRSVDLKFRLSDTALAAGHDAALLLKSLRELGEARVRLDTTALPEPENFNPLQSYLAWEVELQTDAPLSDIEEVFEFVRDICELSIREASVAEDSVALEETATDRSPETLPVPEKPKAERAVSAGPTPRQTIRVDIERVDRLVDVVGELVIHQAMLSEAIDQCDLRAGTEVERGLDQLRQLSRQIQEGVMAIRAQPVKPLFDRMHRIVREACSAAEKSARLVTEGEMTEVDKTIIERLADPLTHMIRNAVDHGLERPELRSKAGKSEAGTITLSAAHRSGRVVITLSDDGGGIDRDRVKQVAVSKGLIQPNAELSPSEIDNLLFMPGFSTASEVSNLSGRGVGMDVVKSEIVGLGGRVSITSNRGEGTTLTISLPLTLAVLDGMVVEVADQLLVLPVSSIVETLRPDNDTKHNIGTEDTVLEIRGAFVPLINVGTRLGFRDEGDQDTNAIVVLVENTDDSILALMVDGIRDQRQVVIKGLEGNYGHIPGIAAATVLGDGSIALILDPTDLANSSTSARTALQALAAE